MAQEQTVVRGTAGASIRAIRTVDRVKQRVLAPGLKKSKLDRRRAQAHGLACDMAGRAGAPVRSEALKERARLVDRPIDVQSSDDAGAIEEELHTLRSCGGRLRAGTAAESATRDCQREDRGAHARGGRRAGRSQRLEDRHAIFHDPFLLMAAWSLCPESESAGQT